MPRVLLHVYSRLSLLHLDLIRRKRTTSSTEGELGGDSGFMTSCLRKKANGVLDSILRSTERELLYPKRLFGMAVRLEHLFGSANRESLNRALDLVAISLSEGGSENRGLISHHLRQAFVPPLLAGSKGS
jgi:hypothetical protein